LVRISLLTILGIGVSVAVAVEPLTLRSPQDTASNAPKLDITGPEIILSVEPLTASENQVEVQPAPGPAADIPQDSSPRTSVFFDEAKAEDSRVVNTDDPVEEVEAEVAAPPKAEVVAEAPTAATPSENAELSEILEKERGLAHQFFKRLEIVDTYVARLKVTVPEVAEKVVAKVEEKVVKVQEKVVEVQDAVAAKIKKLESPISDVDRLPLSDLTANTGLMKKAKLSFDEQSTTWSAVWKKPALFHFGMILHPELMDQVQEGEKLHFESKGMQLALVRTGDDKLLVEQTNGARHELSAKRLEGLLQRSIKVDGLELSLDGGGNLVLKAEGEKARILASKFQLL